MPDGVKLKDVACDLCGTRLCDEVYKAVARAPQIKGAFACTNCWHGSYYRTVRCRDCGLVYSSPRPSESVLVEEYEFVEDAVYIREMNARRRTFARNLRHLERFMAPGRLVDIGANIGVFVDMARAAGWTAEGVEPSAWCAAKANEIFGLNIQTGGYGLLRGLPPGYDAVTSWDVIEHVDSPGDMLDVCRQILKPGGLLAFSTVDIGSWYARWRGKDWPWLMKMHIYYFDRQTIRRYLETRGFEVLHIGVYSHTVSLRYLAYKLRSLGGPLALSGDVLSRVPFSKNIFCRVAMGDFMEVYARKK